MTDPIKVIAPDEVKKRAADSLHPVFSPLPSRTFSESDDVSDFLDLKKSMKRTGWLAKYAPLNGNTNYWKWRQPGGSGLRIYYFQDSELSVTETHSDVTHFTLVRGIWG
jgi:hypothetical protein